MEEIKLTEISKEVIAVAKAAGVFIKGELGKVTKKDIEEKEKNSLVSYVDKQAESIIVSALQKIPISASFITEEETVDQDVSNSGFRWVIDPLDGTTNFLKGIPQFSVSIALEKDGFPIIGVIEDVMLNDTYHAVKGKGAFCNNEKISVSSVTSLDQSVVVTGFPYTDNFNYEAAFKILKHFIINSRAIRRFGSAALDLAYVASGKFDAYYESTLNRWDLSAGALIVIEAGGFISDYNGNDGFLDHGNIIAANKDIHPLIKNTINQFLT